LLQGKAIRIVSELEVVPLKELLTHSSEEGILAPFKLGILEEVDIFGFIVFEEGALTHFIVYRALVGVAGNIRPSVVGLRVLEIDDLGFRC